MAKDQSEPPNTPYIAATPPRVLVLQEVGEGVSCVNEPGYGMTEKYYTHTRANWSPFAHDLTDQRVSETIGRILKTSCTGW